MSDAIHVMAEFIRAWSDGELPDPDAYIDRVPPEERHELSRQITTFLMLAPDPDYDDEAWAQLEADPAGRRAAALPLSAAPEPWTTLLPRLRERAGLTLADVASRLGVGRPARAESYLRAMERGEHDPARVTRRLLEALARVLGVSADALDWRGGPPASGRAPAAAPALLRRAPGAPVRLDSLEILADLAMTEAEELDETDALFLAGREG